MDENIIEITVKAGAKERSVTTDDEGNFIVKTTYPPEKGKANRDVIELLSNHLNLPKSQIEIISGHTYYKKRIKIS